MHTRQDILTIVSEFLQSEIELGLIVLETAGVLPNPDLVRKFRERARRASEIVSHCLATGLVENAERDRIRVELESLDRRLLGQGVFLKRPF